jgi:ABC-2 type transport system ATP-binding protein
MKQRLNLAVALIHDPPVLLLDEPTAALDPASRDALFADLSRLRDDGHAVLLSTHHLDEAELGCDRVAVLDRGKLVACGSPTELLRGRGADRPVVYGHLRVRPPKYLVRALRQRLGPGVELEITGRRVRLSAASGEDLGRALAALLAEGLELDTYRTPAGTLERAMRESPV